MAGKMSNWTIIFYVVLCYLSFFQIRCTRCHGKSERQERMMDLTVEIEGDIETLEDALRKFTGTECLDGDNKYYCGRYAGLLLPVVIVLLNGM